MDPVFLRLDFYIAIIYEQKILYYVNFQSIFNLECYADFFLILSKLRISVFWKN